MTDENVISGYENQLKDIARKIDQAGTSADYAYRSAVNNSFYIGPEADRLQRKHYSNVKLCIFLIGVIISVVLYASEMFTGVILTPIATFIIMGEIGKDYNSANGIIRENNNFTTQLNQMRNELGQMR